MSTLGPNHDDRMGSGEVILFKVEVLQSAVTSGLGMNDGRMERLVVGVDVDGPRPTTIPTSPT